MLYLRNPKKEDEIELEECFDRSVDLHQPWTFKPTDFQAYLEQEHRYLLCFEESEKIVGSFHISNIIRGHFQSAFLGYEVFCPHQNQGYMKVGLKLLLKHAFTQLNLHRLEANVQPDNIASLKLLSGSGFVKEGFSKHYLNVGNQGWRDHERWAILNHAWQPKNS